MSDLAVYDGGWAEEGPIHSVEAEMATLGAVLLATDEGPLLSKVEPEDFYRPGHRHICRAMKALVSKSTPIDPVTLREELKDLGLLAAVGGKEYLYELDLFVPSLANADAYAGTVLDKSVRRELLSLLVEIDAAIRQNRPLSEVWQSVQGLGSVVGRARAPRGETAWRDLVRAQDSGEGLGGVPTGNGDLDSILEYGGFTNGQMTLVMAGSGKGKTTWGAGSVFAACDRGERAAILTYADNNRDDFLRRSLRWKCGIPDLRSAKAQAERLAAGGYPDSGESLMRRFLRAQEDVYGWDLEVYDANEDDEVGSYETGRAWLRRKVDEGLARGRPKPMSLAMWDYAQEINVGDRDLLRLPFYQQQAWVARNMARLCRSVAFPFVVPVQFTKVGDKEEVAECKVWEKVCENWLRIKPEGVEIRKRRRGGDTTFVARHHHDDDRWAFVPARASGEVAL